MMQRVVIARALIEQMLTTGYTLTGNLEVVDGISPGARLAFVDTHEETDSITLVFEVAGDARPDAEVSVCIRAVPHPEPSKLPCGVL